MKSPKENLKGSEGGKGVADGREEVTTKVAQAN